MRFITFLSEKYIFTVSSIPQFQVFVDHDMKELQEAKAGDGTIRFIARFDQKKLYIFHSDVLHNTVHVMLIDKNIIPNEKFHLNGIWGVANVKGKYLEYHSSDTLEAFPMIKTAIIIKYKGKDDWTKKWFKNTLIDSISNYRYY